MIVLNRHREVDELLRKLGVVWGKRRMVRALTGVVTVVGVVVLSLLVVGVCVGYWPDQPPTALRWGMLVVLCGVWLGTVAWFVFRGVLWYQNPSQNARFVEQQIPGIRNDLINAVLLSEDPHQPSEELVRCAIHETFLRSHRVAIEKSVSLRPLKRRAGIAMIGLGLLTLFALLQPGPLTRGMLGVMFPNRYVPSVNAIDLLDLTPGDTTVFAGRELSVTARIRNTDDKPLSARVLIDGASDRPMFSDETNTTFTCPLGPLEQTTRYAVRIGGSRFPTDKPFFTINVLYRVEVEGIELEYEYPSYTGLGRRVVRNSDGGIEGPVGTKVNIALRLSAPVHAVLLDVEGDSPRAMRSDLSYPGTYAGSLMIEKDANYRLLIKDTRNHTIQQLPDVGNGLDSPHVHPLTQRSRINGYFPIRAMVDPAPQVRLITPNRDVTVPPGSTVSIRAKGTDKYGLRELKVIVCPEKDSTHQRVLAQERYAENNVAEAIIEGEFAVGNDIPDDGSAAFICYAQGTDHRVLGSQAGPQTTNSRRIRITVRPRTEIAQHRAYLFDQLRRKLMDILKLQETHRVNTEKARRQFNQLAQIAAMGTKVLAGQRKIRTDLLDLVENFPFDANMVSIRTALAVLASNEGQLAIDRAMVLSGISDIDRRERLCADLGQTQDMIIDTLHTLLGLLPGIVNEPGERDVRSGGQDVPSDTREKLLKLKQEMEEFMASERKVIADSQRLTKTPVDDFTSEDEQLLEKLLGTQDKWEKFLNESFTDFSKLAQQDFSNPSMLKELLSIKSDVTMAKDALSKKAVEIATPFEANAVENARELTANLEKWLPDEPDRIKWAMEDPAGGQENFEQPELPAELEDLVGDLLEQEEDLFDEIDDVTSKYAMSGDKGIGWDATDGPISNMNAQGVTGNQLPNTSELSGRSGEGRSGKSTGEFVQDEAVGKGGRRTPTRLTREPFQKGQVDDKSTEPPGGATGGGKLSGAGAEGLEGPVPPPLARELQRLAGKQAALVNRAERVQVNFKTRDYANFRFLQTISLMDRMRNDLARYRYRNALRLRKEILGSLRETRSLLSGKIEVDFDTSSHMPRYIRDEITDAARGKLPPEFRGLVEQYYRRLERLGEK